ncbi:hypothetical protein PR202_gb11526 [Eleusine coracana subsp. coracana]|uniref:[RNA-polymerase]-subunit kinase n=1 Tax=Eleusine coracana subsp. coracana TaxID=191504 RepID=A0AAV5EMR0_ELECO|nr:hypothetical protein PR202_gb11526 [Eleusine coracana subsp. coracana]
MVQFERGHDVPTVVAVHACRVSGSLHRRPAHALASLVGEELIHVAVQGVRSFQMSDDAPPYEEAGTRWYMAPEMLLGKTDYDALVDDWSLGCVMAELISGSGVLFPGDNNEGKTWLWFSTTPFATGVLPRLRYGQRRSLLRHKFPATMLSQQGFEVLSGLLTWNPDKRLTASAALKHPWFAADLINAPTTASPAARNKMTDPLMISQNLHKRRKIIQCA